MRSDPIASLRSEPEMTGSPPQTRPSKVWTTPDHDKLENKRKWSTVGEGSRLLKHHGLLGNNHEKRERESVEYRVSYLSPKKPRGKRIHPTVIVATAAVAAGGYFVVTTDRSAARQTGY